MSDLLLCSVGTPPGGSGGGSTPSVASFLNTIGFNAHDTATRTELITLVNYSGFRWFRTGIDNGPDAIAINTATTIPGVRPGVRFTGSVTGTSTPVTVNSFTTNMAAIGAIVGFEGPNEPGNAAYTYNGMLWGGQYAALYGGYTTQGALTAAWGATALVGCAAFTVPNLAPILATMSIYISSVTGATYTLALYQAGTNNLLAQTNSFTPAATGWVTQSVTALTSCAGSVYCAFLVTGASAGIAYDSPGANVYSTGVNSIPSTFTYTTNGSGTMSVYATFFDWSPGAQQMRDLYAAKLAGGAPVNALPVFGISEVGAVAGQNGVWFPAMPASPAQDPLIISEYGLPVGTQYFDMPNAHSYVTGTADYIVPNQVWYSCGPVWPYNANPYGGDVDTLQNNYGITWLEGYQGMSNAALAATPWVMTETGMPRGAFFNFYPGGGIPSNQGYTFDGIQGVMNLHCYLAAYAQGCRYLALYELIGGQGSGPGFGVCQNSSALGTYQGVSLTISNANPAVVTWNQTISNGAGVTFYASSGGALPSPLVAGTTYYVVNTGTNQFQISATVSGAAISTSGSSSSGTLYMFSLGWTTWGAPVVCTITNANPAVVSFSTVNFPNGQPAFLATTGTLPSPFVAGTIYYLVNAGMNTHGLAATPGGTAISTNGSSQTGTQICNIIGNACVYLGNLTTILQDAGTAASYPGSLSMTVSYPQATFSAFNAALIGDSEVGAYELGNKITFNQAGYITSIMFEKYSGESITTRGLNIWTTGGVNLKNYTTTGEPTGTTQWITYTLATPYAVTAGESLVISAGYATAFLNLGPPFLYPAGQSPYLQAIAGFNTTSVGSFPSNTGGTYPVDVGFQPSSYAAPTIHYFVLKGSDGNSRIVVWNEEVYNSGVSDNIEFTFGSSYATINIYDPVQGTSAISTLTNQSSVSLTLSDSQINVIELISVVLVVGQFAFNSATQSGLIPVMFGM